MNRPTRSRTKKRKINVTPEGIAHIKASFNNIIITITNTLGETISWASAGQQGFRGAKKNTPYAAQQAANACGQAAFDAGVKKLTVYVKGPGNGREHAIRTLHQIGMEVTTIKDRTPMPHNGCRASKRRNP